MMMGRAVRKRISMATLKKLDIIIIEYYIFSFVIYSFYNDIMWFSPFRYIFNDKPRNTFVITESEIRIQILIDENNDIYRV